METIFDHNVTKEEIDDIWGHDFNEESYKKRYPSQETAYSHIYSLYKLRGDNKTAKKYADKLPNTMWKFFELMNHDRF